MQDRDYSAERLVFLQPQGQKVPHRNPHESRHVFRLLEGHGPGQGHLWKFKEDWDEEDSCFLQGPRPSRPEV